MPISWEIFDIGPVLRVILTDVPHIDDIRAFLDDLSLKMGDRPMLPMFYDLTEMDVRGLGDEFIRAAIVLDRSYRNVKRGRQAYVTADPDTARFIDRYMELIGKYRFAPVARHFRGAQGARALDWLTCEEVDLPGRLI
ncbi:MAG: hypothetical protein AAFO80_03895 [Pseudomonadota bacterium]